MKPVSFIVLFTSVCSAQSALVFSDPQNIPIPTSFTGVSIDLFNATHFNGDPAADWSDSQVNFFRGGDGIFSGPRFLPIRSGTEASDPVIALSVGITIDDTFPVGPVGNGVSQGHLGLAPDQFPNNQEAYLGFQIDLTGTGDFSYGYMRVTLTDGTSPGIIHDWTYSDTPGQAITITAIPEASTPAFLSLLGIILLSQRRRYSRSFL